MCSMMHMLVLHILCLLFGNKLTLSASESEANNPVFNLDHTALEKTIAAVFNKVAHSSATTKRSVPANEAQVSQSTTHSTSPSPEFTSHLSSLIISTISMPKATNPPLFRELPSHAPPTRALFTPPLPPEYSNPFADKPTLRGTNIDAHSNFRRPIPPPSLTPAHERIPIKPPDLIEDTTKKSHKRILTKDRIYDSTVKDQFEMSDRQKDLNETTDILPSLHHTSISRMLSGSNGRKQDIPEILLKPISTKSPSNYIITKSTDTGLSTTMLITNSRNNSDETSTHSSIFTLPNKKMYNTDNDSDSYVKNSEREILLPPSTSAIPDINLNNETVVPNLDTHSLAAYLAAIMFTLIALYSVYKIVRFNDAANFVRQSYFLTIHLLLTIVCTLRCFHLFYDASNSRDSLPQTLSKILMFLPSSLLAASFSTLILYMTRSSTVPSLYQNKYLSPVILIFAFIVYITLCISLHVSGQMLGYIDESGILPLICQCIYIIICVALGLYYMYVYRVIRSQLHITSTKSVSNNVSTDFTTTTMNTAITTTIATALLFILMGFVQLYGVFGVKEHLTHLQPYSWISWGWQFSVRLIELSMCGLLAWVASLTQYQFQEKQIQQHTVHSGFALFPCGSSTSTENMDDALYPTICSTNQAIQNYTIRTGKHVYDDSFPLNTLPEHLNITNTFERHSARKSGPLNHLQQEMRNSFSQRRNGSETICQINGRNKHDSMTQNMQEHSATSGSTMLVAEDGFVRFRNLGPDEDDLLHPQSVIGSTDERRNSISCSDRFNIKQSTVVTQMPHNYHQNSLPHLHLSLHRNQHQIYNNT